MKAGDLAPKLVWTKILASSPGSAGPENLAGQTTVLLFLPFVLPNQKIVGIWNDLVERFAGRPVKFICIATEEESALIPFLAKHPVRGCLILDPEEGSYKAFGIEGWGGVLIDSSATIAGFTLGPPRAEQIEAVTDGRAIAVPYDEATEEQLDAFFEGKSVQLEPKPLLSLDKWRADEPDLPPSEDVYISKSTSSAGRICVAPHQWVYRGLDLKTLLSNLLNIDPARMEFPAALDDRQHFDFILTPPQREDEETMRRRMLVGIEKYFGVKITREQRSTDVYVVRLVKGRTPRPGFVDDSSFVPGRVGWRTFTLSEEFRFPRMRTRKEAEQAMRELGQSAEYQQKRQLALLKTIATAASTMDNLRRTLEDALHRPAVDETGLTGIYDLRIQGEPQTTEEFLQMMREQVGLTAGLSHRNMEIVVVSLR